jgi:ankyrin repeat protein
MLWKSLVTAVLVSGIVIPAFAADVRLAAAAKAGDVEGVRALLKEKVNVNEAQGDGMTPLHWAVYANNFDVAQILVKAGANVKAVTRLDASTPLLMAATNGNVQIMELLINAGADVNAASSIGTTPLMQSAASGNVDAVRLLIDHGANVNAKDTLKEQTPLMFAATMDRAPVIRLLVAKGAKPNVTSKVLPIDLPLFDDDGNPIPQRGLVTDAAGNPIESYGQASAKFMGGMTPLHYAAREGHMDAIQALVESGADLNVQNPGDKTTVMIEAIVNGHYDIAKYLVERGGNPNLPSIDGLEALYATIDNEYAPVAWSATSHTWADGTAQQKTSYLELMAVLLEHGADPNARIVRPLWFRPPHHNQMWVKTSGSTPFWRAAQATDLLAMKLLVSRGADPRMASTDKDTPLAMAAGIGWSGNYSINAPYFLDAVKYLVEEAKVDVNTVDKDGYTAIFGAAYRGDNEMVKYLVDKGARLDLRNNKGWSVTDMTTAPNVRSSVGLAHPETEALVVSLGAPTRLKVDDEEILGIIKRKITTPDDKKKP